MSDEIMSAEGFSRDLTSTFWNRQIGRKLEARRVDVRATLYHSLAAGKMGKLGRQLAFADGGQFSTFYSK